MRKSIIKLVGAAKFNLPSFLGTRTVGRNADVTDADLAAILQMVDLGYLLERFTLDSVQTWEDLLSGGEVQRIGFARVFYHRPKSGRVREGEWRGSGKEECLSSCAYCDAGAAKATPRSPAVPASNLANSACRRAG